MNHCISLLYRPKILKHLINMDNNQNNNNNNNKNRNKNNLTDLNDSNYCDDIVINDNLICTMNGLIEIIILTTKSILKFSPKLINLLTDHEFTPSQWNSLIQIQFNAPKLSLNGLQYLTYGSVLSAVNILTRALNLVWLLLFSINYLNF